MPGSFKTALRLRVELLGTAPPVWRLIEVPARYTFWELHVAIQDAMGWDDSHLHEFELAAPDGGKMLRFGIPDPDAVTQSVEPGWMHDIVRYMSHPGTEARYTYDFGDEWSHAIRLEALMARDSSARYPRCLSGARACPPEDCGGPSAYERLLEGDEELLEWLGGDFDPDRFDPGSIKFSDPNRRLRRLLDA